MSSRIVGRRFAAVALLVYLVAGPFVAAPAGAQSADSWETTIAIYLMAAGMDGEVGVGDVTADLDVSFSDILEDLSMGMMGAYEMRRNDIAIGIDVIYMDLEGNRNSGSLGFAAEVAQTMVGADVAYGLNERLEVLGGLRYSNFDTKAAVSSPLGTQVREDDEDWIDPYVGARWSLPFAQGWDLKLRFDVGGFGVGSELAWQAVARFDWHVGDNFDVLFGYRIIDVDYDDGAGADRFVFDVQSKGPVAGIAWQF